MGATSLSWPEGTITCQPPQSSGSWNLGWGQQDLHLCVPTSQEGERNSRCFQGWSRLRWQPGWHPALPAPAQTLESTHSNRNSSARHSGETWCSSGGPVQPHPTKRSPKHQSPRAFMGSHWEKEARGQKEREVGNWRRDRDRMTGGVTY